MEISICLTNLQGFSLTTNVDIYSNVDGYTTPIYTNVPVSSLYGANCTFTATVPSGSTIIQIIDPIGGCDSFITIESSDFCDNCNLRFSVFSSTTICRIVAGLLIDDCSGTTITDYIIDWYGPSSSTNIAYTSGYGNAFLGYNYTHPLENNTAIVAAPGVYFPQIRKIKINGLVFTQTGGTGSYLADLNSCLSGVTSQVSVSEYTCTNGSSSKSQYTHEVHFTALANGAPPAPSTATIDLSSTTQYFAWAFRAQQVPDRLDFIFSGSSYSEPILLESLYTGQGGNLMTNPGFSNNTFSATTVTKSGGTLYQKYIPKVTVLTGLTINNGDKIIVVVTPNTQNNQTNWDLFFNACLTTFDCNNCLFDNQPNYLISGGTPIFTGPDSCGKYGFSWVLSGCNNTFLSTDFYKYVFFGDYTNTTFPQNFFLTPTTKYQLEIGPATYFTSNGITPTIGQTSHYPILYNCQISWYDEGPIPNLCVNPPNNNYIRYTKFNIGLGGTGVFKMYFSDITDFSFYWSKIQFAINSVINPEPVYSILSTELGHFKYFALRIPSGTAVGNTPCGDDATQLNFVFHISSIVTSGFTGGYYEIELTMPTIINNITPNSCDNCRNAAQTITDEVNNSSTGTTLDITSNRGSRYVYPWYGRALSSSIQSITETIVEPDVSIPKYFNNTYMYSGTPYSYLPSLTTELCDYTNEMSLFRDTSFPISSDNFYWSRIIYKYHIYTLNGLNRFARINTDGSVNELPYFEYGFTGSYTRGTIELPSGKYIIFGQFKFYNFTSANSIICINQDGSIDNTFLTNMGSGFSSNTLSQPDVLSYGIQSDGKIILCGIFNQYNGNNVQNIVRIYPDGTYDPTFSVTFNNQDYIWSLFVQSDDKILISGSFNTVNGVSRVMIARINPNGSTTDTSFILSSNPGFAAGAIIQQPDLKFVVTGYYLGGPPNNFGIYRFDLNGNLDTTFNNNIGSGPDSGLVGGSLALILQPSDNKILFGYLFNSFNGDTTKKTIVRLMPDGTIDPTFDFGGVGFLGDNKKVNTLKLDSFGNIYVGGEFSSFNYQSYKNIVKLLPNGNLDTSFNPGIGFDSLVTKIDIDSNNKLVVNGGFTRYNNYPNNFYNFGIYTYTLDKGNVLGNPFPIYKYSGGTITYSDPTYII